MSSSSRSLWSAACGSAIGSNDAVGGSDSTLNWAGATNVDPKSGVYTLMGPGFYLAEDGENIEYNKDGGKLVKTAIDIMRVHGYRCKLPPKNHDWHFEFGDEYTDEEAEEKDFLEDNYNDAHEVFEKKSNSLAFVVTAACDWIYIRCMTEESKEFAMEHIMHSDQSEFCYLALVAHDEVTETVDETSGLSITRRSGNKDNDPSSITTLFEMKLGSTIIAKSLCTYFNMTNAGPTIKLFEVAKEWRRKKYGSKLVKAMNTYYKTDAKVGSIYQAMIYVTENEERRALRFFKRLGFSDPYGLGEELEKSLWYDSD